MDIAESLINERHVSVMLKGIEEALEDANEEQAKELREWERKLRESLSTGDWTKLGIALGLLWHKLDDIISGIKDSNGYLRRIATRR